MHEPHVLELVAGDLAVDLVNTVSWRGDASRRIDRLADFATLTDWCVQASVIDARAARRLRRAGDVGAVERVRGLREELHTVLVSVADGAAPAADALDVLHQRLAGAIGRARPTRRLPLRWELAPDTPDALHDLLALRALRLLESPEVARVGRCSDDSCGWLFVDRTRNHSRRWCSSDECGNRARASRHYARRRARG